MNLGFSKFTAHDILRWRPLLHVCELHTLKAASFFSGKTSPLVCRGAIYNIFTHLQLFTNTCSVYFPLKCVCRTKQLKAATRCAACSWLHSWFLLTKKNLLSHSLEAETQKGTGSFYVCSLSGQSDTQNAFSGKICPIYLFYSIRISQSEDQEEKQATATHKPACSHRVWL